MAGQFQYDSLPVVETKAGKLRGYQWEGTYIFKGIRYARAKRFQLPEEAEPWEGVREAASYGFVCPMLTRDNPQGELLVPHRYWPQDEDCLSLNIWSQSLDRSAKKPVLFWIHGGAFSMGSSIEQKAYNGENMSKYGDVVVVTVNHRLNILGYFDMSPYGEKYAGSANAGQADLVAALLWVRDNIEAFGGDPGNVTIFGQSGGGMKVSGLMQTPEADGLFHKGMIMSGVAGDILPYSTGDSRPLIRAMLEELGLTEDEAGRLETIPYHDLAAAYNRVSPAVAGAGGYIGCTPKPDDFYKGEGPAVGFTEHAKTIPVMVGTVFGEFAMAPLPFNKEQIPEAELDAVLDNRFQGRGKELKAVFAEAYPGKNPADLLTLDTIFRGPTREFVRALAAAGGSVYSYLFALEFPYQNQKTAWHCSDIPFVFHNTELVPAANIPEVSDRLQEQIFGAVMAFARTGKPEYEGLPQWPASRENDEATMIFDRVCEVRHNHDDRLLKLHAEASPKFDLAAMMAKMGDEIQH